MELLMWVMVLLIIAALIVLVFVLLSFKHRIMIIDETNGTGLIVDDKFKETTNRKTGVRQWKLLKSRRTVQPAPAECIGIISGMFGSKKIAIMKMLPDGGSVWVKPGKSFNNIAGLDWVSAEEKAFLAEQIHKANDKPMGDWLKTNALPMTALLVLGIGMVCMLMFWEDIWGPIGATTIRIEQMQKTNGEIAETQLKILRELNHLKWGTEYPQELTENTQDSMVPPGGVPK